MAERRPLHRGDTSVIQRVATALRESIVRGRYHAGERLNQSRLATELHVSRIPVREALRLLEAEGLATFDHNAGARVARLTPEDVRDIFEMRVELETLALRTAITSATARTVDAAAALLDRMDGLTGAAANWLQLNHRFHGTLYAPGRRRHLLRTIQTLRQTTEPYLRLYLMALGRFEVSQQQHRRILQAYARGDVTRAEAALRKHLTDTMRELLRALGGDRTQAAVRM